MNKNNYVSLEVAQRLVDEIILDHNHMTMIRITHGN